MATAFGMVKNFLWLIFVAVPCGPLVQLPLRSTTELEQLIPKFFEEKQGACNRRILCTLGTAKRSTVDVNMEPTGARLVARIAQLFCFFHDPLPRHAAQVEIESHRVGDDLEPIVEAAVVLAVGQRMFSIGDVQDLGSVVTIFTGTVDLKLNAEEAVAVAIENGSRFVVIIVDSVPVTNGVIAFLTIRVISTEEGVPPADQGVAGCTAFKVIVEAVLTQRLRIGSHIVVCPDTAVTAGAVDRLIAQAGGAKKLAVKRKQFVLQKFFSAVGADELRQRKDFVVLFNKFVRQRLKIFAVRRCGAQEKGTADNVVNLAGFGVFQRAILGQACQLTFVVADHGDRILERVDGFNETADKGLHGCERAIDFDGAGFSVGFDK